MALNLEFFKNIILNKDKKYHFSKSGLFFIAGLVLVIVGVYFIQTSSDIYWKGFLIASIGAALSGFGARDVIANRLDSIATPHLKPRKDSIVCIAIVLAIVAHAFLYYHLITHQYTHFDILLFFSGIVLIGVTLWRFGVPKLSLHIPRWDTIILIILCTATLAGNAVHLIDWRFVVIGDEGAFLDLASYFSENGDEWSFFNLQGAYGIHPDLDSAYQALFLKLFGNTVFSWRLSTVFVQVLSVALIYLVALLLWGRLPAITSAVVLGSSHYLMAFNHIAYNNTHCIFYALLAIFSLIMAIRTQSIFFAYLTGVSLGFGIYTVAIALLTWAVIPAFLLLGYLFNPSKRRFWFLIVVLFGILLTAAPGIIASPDHFSKILGTETHLGHVATREQTYSGWLNVVSTTFKYSAISWWFNSWSNHYVSGPFVDPITGVFLFIGLFIALFRFKHPSEQLLLIWFFLSLLIISITSGAPEPLPTRMMYLLPPVALLSGIAVAAFYVFLRSFVNFSKLASGMIIFLILLSIPILNVHQFFFVSPKATSPSIWDLKFKVFQEHPDTDIVEIVNKNMQESWLKIINWYPSIKTHYTYLEFSELENFTRNSSFDNSTLFFLDKYNMNISIDVIQSLRRYTPIKEYDEHGEYQALLFVKK